MTRARSSEPFGARRAHVNGYLRGFRHAVGAQAPQEKTTTYLLGHKDGREALTAAKRAAILRALEVCP